MTSKRDKSHKKISRRRKKGRKKIGKGLLNTLINKLPFEMHVPTYQFCGPGTKLDKRLKRNDPGINELDRACKEHDIAYANNKNTAERNQADKILARKAWERVKASDAGFGEKAVALGISGIMKAKSKLGMGFKKKAKSSKKKKKKNMRKSGSGVKRKPAKLSTSIPQIYKNIVENVKSEIKNKKPQNLSRATELAIEAAKVAVKKHKISKKNIKKGLPRIIPVPKIGGALPLIPIFAGLSALGALMGGSASVANAVTSANNAKKKFKEAQRHNQTMEAIAIGKSGEKTGAGLYIMPYKKGLGLYLSANPKNL